MKTSRDRSKSFRLHHINKTSDVRKTSQSFMDPNTSFKLAALNSVSKGVKYEWHHVGWLIWVWLREGISTSCELSHFSLRMGRKCQLIAVWWMLESVTTRWRRSTWWLNCTSGIRRYSTSHLGGDQQVADLQKRLWGQAKCSQGKNWLSKVEVSWHKIIAWGDFYWAKGASESEMEA